MSAPPASSLPWRRRLREIATERLGLKAIALVLALLLWLVVSARQPTESYVRVRLSPALDSTLVLLPGTTEVRALVAARAADFVKLVADPPVVRRSIGGDAPDTLMLRFEMRASRRVPIVNDGRVVVLADSSVRAGDDVVFEPRAVRVTGPRRVVRRLRGIHPYSLTIAMNDTMPHVADLDTTGTGVEVQPAQVKVQWRGAPTSMPSSAGDTTMAARP